MFRQGCSIVLKQGVLDHAAAHDEAVLIQDDRLTGGHHSHRRCKSHQNLVFTGPFDAAAAAAVIVIDLGLPGFVGSRCQSIRAHEGKIVDPDGSGDQVFRLGDDDFVGFGTDFLHENAVAHSEFKAFALADRIMNDTFVAAKNCPVRRDEIAWFRHVTGLALDVACVIRPRNEADFLTIGFGRDREAGLFGDFANLRLGICASSHRAKKCKE